MAKNYTINEAVKIIRDGTDLESIADIGKRYPILLHKVTKLVVTAGEDFVSFMGFMPDYLTANKVNTAIKASIVTPEETEEEETEEAPVVKAIKPATKKAKEESEVVEETTKVEWNESMTAKKLWDLLGQAGKRKEAKSTKKVDLIDACMKVFGGAKDVEEIEVEETETPDIEEVENPYEGKSAMELFKICKERGLKAAPKKPAKFYVDLLVKDDEAKDAKPEADDEWEEDEVEETPKKPVKKAAKKIVPKKAKPAKKVEVEEADEDDDWDI